VIQLKVRSANQPAEASGIGAQVSVLPVGGSTDVETNGTRSHLRRWCQRRERSDEAGLVAQCQNVGKSEG
jgi:hypothetical protein